LDRINDETSDRLRLRRERLAKQGKSRKLNAGLAAQAAAADRYHGPDELMFQWNNIPRDTQVKIYLPEVLADEILRLNELRQHPTVLGKLDDHTLSCKVADVGFLPLPGGRQGNLAGLLSLTLPPSVRTGQVYRVNVQQISGLRRKILGGFQLTMLGGSIASHVSEIAARKVFGEEVKLYTRISVFRHPVRMISRSNAYIDDGLERNGRKSFISRLNEGSERGTASEGKPRLIRLARCFHIEKRCLVTICYGVVPLLVLLASSSSAQPMIGNCSVFPANNIWNTPIDKLPVAANSALLVNTIGPSLHLHADFGAGTYNGEPIGIPFVTVSGNQTKYPTTFQYADESDPGPYAIPTGDRHAIAIDTGNCILYELYSAYPQAASWQAGSGAIFDLKANTLRPAGWTSADAAGLPIFPGLVRYDEVAAGEIRHAIRLTVPQTLLAYVWPGRHYASSLTDPKYPPMGQRFRLRASFDISGFSADAQVILRALQRYGMFVADNGSAWYISGAPDPRWNNSNLSTLRNVLGSDFEAVDDSMFMVIADSAQAASCDLNDDGVVNVLDVQIEVNATLGVVPCGAGDLDGNRRCDVVDLQRVIAGALGSACRIGP
jgi:hypothetical protein